MLVTVFLFLFLCLRWRTRRVGARDPALTAMAAEDRLLLQAAGTVLLAGFDLCLLVFLLTFTYVLWPHPVLLQSANWITRSVVVFCGIALAVTGQVRRSRYRRARAGCETWTAAARSVLKDGAVHRATDSVHPEQHPLCAMSGPLAAVRTRCCGKPVVLPVPLWPCEVVRTRVPADCCPAPSGWLIGPVTGVTDWNPARP